MILWSLTYVSEVQKWSEVEQSRVWAVEKSYEGCCWNERVRNEEVCGSFGMSEKAVNMNCGVMKQVEIYNLIRWQAHVRRMPEEIITTVNKVYLSNITGMFGKARLFIL